LETSEPEARRDNARPYARTPGSAGGRRARRDFEASVAHRNAKGAFRSRKDLLSVPRLGPRSCEQSAGFLRIRGGTEPLHASAVHPEAYGLARRIVARLRS
jgi:transcriptional accessory protein Tex/SPT6